MENEQIPPVEIDPDFQPQSRPRSCTWPLPRPDISTVKQEGVESAVNTPPTEDEKPEVLPVISEPENGNAPEGEILVGGAGAAQRKGPSRRNAWGNQSYADLISQAIENSPEKRLTLAQIYDWMVNTVPYFKDKGDSNSSAGWKNSIRHNLSLHSKFLRVHNESTGKSSWWMLNPEGGKSGKTPRRRAASMDNSSKLLKSRVRAAKTKKQTTATSGITQEGQTGNTENPGNGSQQQFPKWNVNSSSPSSRGSMEDPDIWTAFRPRTSSNASTLSGRLSPIAPGHEDDDNLGDDDLHTTLATYSASSVPPTLTETLMEDLELIDSLNLISSQQNNSSSTSSVNSSSSVLPSAAVLLQRSSSFSSYPQLQQSKPQLAQNNSSTGGTAVSSFGNSLFSPLSSTAGANRVGGHFSSSVDGTRLPTSLETLLTSDSPPPSDVMMSQVDPIMPSPSSTSLHILSSQLSQGKLTGQIILGKNQEQNSSLNLTLQQQQRTHLLGNSTQALGLGMLVQGVNSDSSNLPALKPQLPQGPSSPSGLLVSGVQSSVGSIPGISQFSGAGCFLPGHDKLPNDLDIEMFTENLDCDVDYIINSDLMDGDGMDFNFDPILTTNQNFSTSSTTQGSSHSWVPS
ncbi:forkhead box protein O1 [Erpetoichthys calabaricus]|uniref:Forkhead box O4 n=1 Tax=Erpetoichthys calabaricus TaxID=27687 RepID=A0A8C4SJW9_ERPCA|nr:forkhead box protein O1 [Erpetoichthys calabaricus]